MIIGLGADRGLAIFFACADLERQYEFVQKEWINAPKFQGLLNDKDPMAGDRNGTFDASNERTRRGQLRIAPRTEQPPWTITR